jgi:hypothetical protein
METAAAQAPRKELFMASSSLRRKTAVLLLGAVLATPLVSAASPRALPAQRTASLFEAVLARLLGTLTSLWGEEGCSLDPYGGCTRRSTAIPPVTPDNGCYIDPYGGCTGTGGAATSPGETLDEGCSADPYGRCSGGS